MARQSNTPVQFQRSSRSDNYEVMTSGRAGKVIMVDYLPVLRGDMVRGKVGVDVDLAEMPRPLQNAVVLNAQAWFVPKSCFPQFSGMDEFIASYQGQDIKALGAADRTPPSFYNVIADSGDLATVRDSEMFKTLGIHVPVGKPINADLIDAFWLVYNFRLAAHSSRLARADYSSEDIGAATAFPRAFWPTSRITRFVPDYERALVVGSLDLDVLAGQIPVMNLGLTTAAGSSNGAANIVNTDGSTTAHDFTFSMNDNTRRMAAKYDSDLSGYIADIYAEMAGQSLNVTLADIDKARTTQAFAKLRTAYAGNDATGFDNDDMIVNELMLGLRVPDEMFKRPWLLDSKRVNFGMSERPATDGANLDMSVTKGRASAQLSINVPTNDVGGMVIVTVEVLPEQLLEAATDEYHLVTSVDSLPNALRDVQRPEPVDLVLNRRLDARHTSPDGLYGYEGMNDVWNREGTRLGGVFYQDDPLNPFVDQRAAIWQTSVVDPEFTSDHFLAPDDFPHDVFADTLAPAFEVVVRHISTLTGLTQIGDVLDESNDDYDAVSQS